MANANRTTPSGKTFSVTTTPGGSRLITMKDSTYRRALKESSGSFVSSKEQRSSSGDHKKK